MAHLGTRRLANEAVCAMTTTTTTARLLLLISHPPTQLMDSHFQNQQQFNEGGEGGK